MGRKKRSDSIDAMALEDDHNAEHNLIGDNDLKEEQSMSDHNGSPAVYKYNQNEQFIVAKEVEALIIDLPEVIDEAVFSV